MRNTRNAAAIAALLALAAALCCPALALAADESLAGGSAADTSNGDVRTAVSKKAKASAKKKSAPKTAFTKQTVKLDVDSIAGSAVANGTYYIAASKNTGFALGVSKENAVLQKLTYTASQRWKFEFDYDSQSYTVVNERTGKALTVSGSGKGGSNVRVAKLAKRNQRLSRYASRTIALPAQRWVVRSVPTGYRLVSVANNKVILNVAGSKPKAGANAAVKSYASAKQGKFWLLGTGGNKALKNGVYAFAAPSGKLMGVKGSSLSAGASLAVAKNAGLLSQAFRVRHVSKGYYQIISENSNMALTAAGASRVVQSKTAASPSKRQLWKLKLLKNGQVRFTNAATKRVLSYNSKGRIAQKRASQVAEGWKVSPVTTGLSAVARKALYRANELTSSTKYCCVVDMTAHELFLFQKLNPKHAGGAWKIVDQCRCAIGMPGHRTISCTTTFGEKAVHRSDINAKWTIYVHHGSWLHSTLYGAPEKDQLGWNISHACIRIPFKDAEFIYNTAPVGTKMLRYY